LPSMFRILLALLLAGLVCSLSQAQSPNPSTPLLAAEPRREAQPPEQSGQSQQMMKEARAELERTALELKAAVAAPDALTAAREALVQFQQSLEQLHQSVPGYVPLELATSLNRQVSDTLELVISDPEAASASMLELALRVTDLTAEADLLIGRSLLGADGAKLGNISNVLITAQGRIEALIVDRTAPNKDQQFAVEWTDVSVQGTNLVTDLTPAQTDRLPGYVAD